MQEKVELNKIRSFGEIINDSILFFKQNWRPLLKSYFYICGFFWIASLIVTVLNQVNTLERVAQGESIFTFTYFLALLFTFVSSIMTMLTVYSYISLYKEKGNEAPGVDEVWSFVKYYFFRVFGNYIVIFICAVIGFFFCIIPGLYLGVAFSLFMPIMIVENSTLSYAFNRCFQLIKNNWWFTFGIILISFVIIVTAMLAVGIPVAIIAFGVTFLTNAHSFDVYQYATIGVTHLLQFLYIYPYIVIGFTYFSFVEQKDEGTLLQRIMNLGKPANADDNITPETTEEF
jgi:hypothetical protein